MVEAGLLWHFPLAVIKYSISGKPSPLYTRCLEEVKAISSATLFLPVTSNEAVRSMSETYFPPVHESKRCRLLG